MKKLEIKPGFPTAYGFACGYQQLKQKKNSSRRIRLFMEHGVYHLIVFGQVYRESWESFRTLTAARKAFNEASKAMDFYPEI